MKMVRMLAESIGGFHYKKHIVNLLGPDGWNRGPNGGVSFIDGEMTKLTTILGRPAIVKTYLLDCTLKSAAVLFHADDDDFRGLGFEFFFAHFFSELMVDFPTKAMLLNDDREKAWLWAGRRFELRLVAEADEPERIVLTVSEGPGATTEEQVRDHFAANNHPRFSGDDGAPF